jgi:hypothetical protein
MTDCELAAFLAIEPEHALLHGVIFLPVYVCAPKKEDDNTITQNLHHGDE